MAYNPQVDDVLARLASGHQGLEDFLGSIFAFFERRTDLFHVMQKKDDKMGFPPGVAEQMVLAQFRKYQDVYQKRTGNQPPADLDKAIKRQEGKPLKAADIPSKDASTNVPSSPSTSAPKSDSKMQHISTWNGAVTDRYRWMQSLEEITLEVCVGDDEKVDVKQLKVDIKPEHLSIKYKDKTVLSGKFHERVEPAESLWNLEDKKKLILTLDKVRKTWWKCVFEGDPEIDTTKVESVKRIEEYDGSTQGVIRKIVFDQNQKAQGKPTSDQIRTAELMKGAWNAENSPFKGTEFDPSILNLTNPVPEHMFN